MRHALRMWLVTAVVCALWVSALGCSDDSLEGGGFRNLGKRGDSDLSPKQVSAAVR
jgi:hypothetical protein